MADVVLVDNENLVPWISSKGNAIEVRNGSPPLTLVLAMNQSGDFYHSFIKVSNNVFVPSLWLVELKEMT